MNKKISELEELLTQQENYFDNLIDLGLLLENSGQLEKAFEVYKKGISKAEKAKIDISATMLGLID